MYSVMNHENQIRDIDDELDDIEQEEDLKRFDDFLNSEEHHILLDGLIHEPGTLLYQSSSGRFYIRVFERRIIGHGYSGELRRRSERDFDVVIGDIRQVFAFDGNLEIWGEHFIYKVPSLNHVEIVDFEVCLLVEKYFERVKHRHENA